MQNGQQQGNILGQVEAFLLPSVQSDSNNAKKVIVSDFHELPLQRLDRILYEVALADHIRSMQTMYRDSNDEQSLVAELRANVELKLPMKHLMDKMIEGRARCLGLVKICYGNGSIEMMKATLDLANSYALKGMWPQVEENISRSSGRVEELLIQLGTTEYAHKVNRSLEAAERICCTYRVLREHVSKNNGQVTKKFVKELVTELVKFPSRFTEEEQDDLGIGHPSKIAFSLKEFFATNSVARTTKGLKTHGNSYFPKNNGSPGKTSPNGKSSSGFDATGGSGGGGAAEGEDWITTETRSWGNMVDFFRHRCEVMIYWVEEMEKFILPQNKANLLLPFRLCDPQKRNVAHPIHVSRVINQFPSTARLLATDTFSKGLAQMNVEVPLIIDMKIGNLFEINQIDRGHEFDMNSPALARNMNLQNVFYELPITKEEYLSRFVLGNEVNQLDVMRVQLLTLKGVSEAYSSNPDGLTRAEASLKDALNLLEQLGLEMVIIACELYNSIAQMLIMKHRQWNNGKRMRAKQEVDIWLTTDEGKAVLNKQIVTTKASHAFHTNRVISTAEQEAEAKNIVTKKKLHAVLADQPNDAVAMNETLQAAYRYLVRSFDILEDAQGAAHPSVGTACLAVASVQNVLHDLDDTREWLMKSLRYMEKYQPVPVRALAFTQTQLSQVLQRRGYNDEARRVLSKAVQFHMSVAIQGVTEHNLSQSQPFSSSSHAAGGGAGREGPLHKHHQKGGKREGGGGGGSENPPDTARSGLSSANGGPETHRSNLSDNTGGGGNDDGKEKEKMPGVNITPVCIILKNSPLYDDILAAVDLATKLIKLNVQCGEKWQAVHLAEQLSQLAESAFGWDSVEAAEAYKQVGVRCAAVSDWGKATRYLRLCAECCEVLYGKDDSKTTAAIKLLRSARNARSGLPPSTNNAAGPGVVAGIEDKGSGSKDGRGGDKNNDISSAPTPTTARSPAVSPRPPPGMTAAAAAADDETGSQQNNSIAGGSTAGAAAPAHESEPDDNSMGGNGATAGKGIGGGAKGAPGGDIITQLTMDAENGSGGRAESKSGRTTVGAGNYGDENIDGGEEDRDPTDDSPDNPYALNRQKKTEEEIAAEKADKEEKAHLAIMADEARKWEVPIEATSPPKRMKRQPATKKNTYHF